MQDNLGVIAFDIDSNDKFDRQGVASSQPCASRVSCGADSRGPLWTIKLSVVFIVAGAQQQSASFVQSPTVTVVDPRGLTMDVHRTQLKRD